MLDINKEETKKIIKNAERKFNNWKKNKGLEEDKWAKEKYLARKAKVIYFDNNKAGASKITIRNPEKYKKFCEIFSAIDALERQREFARNKNTPK